VLVPIDVPTTHSHKTMAEIIKGLGNLVQSFFQIIWGTVTTIFNAITGTIEAALNVVFGVLKGFFNVSEDFVKLIAGEFIPCRAPTSRQLLSTSVCGLMTTGNTNVCVCVSR
jgi:hypothetical protein